VISVSDQAFFFKGVRLENKETVGFYGVAKGSQVDLVLLPTLQLVVKTSSGKKIPLEVNCGDSIREVKSKIEDKEGLFRSCFCCNVCLNKI
jgi:ubiquitin C